MSTKKKTVRRPKVLMGWTRIADFLECSVATAKRKEREGLPIVRVGGAVCCFPEDVVAWRKGRRRARK
ncbi:MAG TPA: hypothetical protein VMX79_09785 [bacterium]|nr:hypothetical protein [bacterium]